MRGNGDKYGRDGQALHCGIIKRKPILEEHVCCLKHPTLCIVEQFVKFLEAREADHGAGVACIALVCSQGQNLDEY